MQLRILTEGACRGFEVGVVFSDVWIADGAPKCWMHGPRVGQGEPRAVKQARIQQQRDQLSTQHRLKSQALSAPVNCHNDEAMRHDDEPRSPQGRAMLHAYDPAHHNDWAMTHDNKPHLQ